MRSTLVCVVAAALLAATANAIGSIDYTSMAPPRVTPLGDGHTRFEHHLERTFTHNVTGKQTTTSLHAMAEIHERWQFVQLGDYGIMNGPIGQTKRCLNASKIVGKVGVLCRDDTACQAAMVALRQPYAVVTATGLRCGGRAVLGHVTNVSIDAGRSSFNGVSYPRLRVTYRLAQLEDFFRHASIRLHTNHYVSKSFEPEAAAAVMEAQQQQAMGGEEWGQEGAASTGRGMHAQGWFHHLTHHISHDIHHIAHHISHDAHNVAHHISHDAKKVAHGVKKAYDHAKDAVIDVKKDVEHFADEVKNVATEAEGLLKKAEQLVKDVVVLAEGDFDVDHTWTLAKASWGDSSVASSLQAPMPAANKYAFAHYGHFAVHFHFELEVHHYKVETLTATIEGDAEFALAVAARGEVSKTFSKQVADVRLPSINFAIGPVPVHIQPYIPVVIAGTVDASAEIEFGVKATGSVTYGFTYTHGHFHPVAEHSYGFTHKFSEPQSPHLSVTASVTPSLALNIDFLGGPIVTIRAIAACNLVDNDQLVITAQPVVELSAVFELRILGHTVLGPKTLGPYKKDGSVYHLGTIHIPNLDPGHRSRALRALAAPTLRGCPVLDTARRDAPVASRPRAASGSRARRGAAVLPRAVLAHPPRAPPRPQAEQHRLPRRRPPRPLRLWPRDALAHLGQ